MGHTISLKRVKEGVQIILDKVKITFDESTALGLLANRTYQSDDLSQNIILTNS